MANARHFIGTEKELPSLFPIKGAHNVRVKFVKIKEAAMIQPGVRLLRNDKHDDCQLLMTDSFFLCKR
jgi:hypothetical protein